MEMISRSRRLRSSQTIRDMVRETRISNRVWSACVVGVVGVAGGVWGNGWNER